MKNPSIQKKLTKYTGIAAATLSSQAVFGQILYTDVSPDEVVTGNFGVFHIDINQDNAPDFSAITIDTLYLAAPLKAAGFGYYYTSTYGYGNSSNEVIFSGNGVAKLDNGDLINAPNNWSAGGFLGAKLYGYPIYNLAWDPGAEDKFVGVKLELNGNFHYGWVRLDVSPGSDTIVVKDMAINLTAGAPINAGASGLSTIEELKSQMSITSANGILSVLTEPTFGDYTVKVSSLNGQVIENIESRAGERVEMATDHWSKGIYVVALVREDYVLSEKILVD
jgi:hypothetical protein